MTQPTVLLTAKVADRLGLYIKTVRTRARVAATSTPSLRTSAQRAASSGATTRRGTSTSSGSTTTAWRSRTLRTPAVTNQRWEVNGPDWWANTSRGP